MTLQYLQDLRSALGTISTHDNDTIVMGKCLESLNYYIGQMEIEEKRQKEQEE